MNNLHGAFVVDNNGLTGAGAGNIGFTGPTFDTVQANLIDIVTFPDESSFTSANIEEIIAQPGGGDVDAFKFWEGTNAEYNALGILDPNTLYSTTDDTPTLIPDGLSITDTDKLNLLDGASVLSTVTLPTGGGGGEADSIIRQPGGNTIEPLKFWTGTRAEYNALLDAGSIAEDIHYNIIDDIGGGANTGGGSGGTQDLFQTIGGITAGSPTDTLNIVGGTNVTITPDTSTDTITISATGGGGASDSVVRQPDGSTIAPIKFWTGTQAQYDALTRADDVLYNITDTEGTLIYSVLGTTNEVNVNTADGVATVSLDTAITSAITTNTSKITYPASASTKLATIATNADVTLDSISAGTNITISGTGVISSSGGGGTSTTVVGTSGEVDVNTVGNTATVSLDTAITSAITASTTKLATLSADSIDRQTGGSTTDPIKIWTGTKAQYDALTRQDDVLYNVTDTSGTIIFSVLGTSGQIDVSTADGVATVSIDSDITDAIDLNTNKTGITSAQATAITDNTSKVGITTAQATAITNNTNKVGITSAQATAITDNTAKNSYPTADSNKLATLSADSIDRQTGGSTTDPIKIWTGTQAQYDALTPASDVLYNITDTSGTLIYSVSGTANQVNVVTADGAATVSLDSAITNAITNNSAKTGISAAQASAIVTNTNKVGITTAQSNAITANTAKTGISTAQATAITNNTAKVGITTAQSTAITNNTAKVGITTAQSNAITANTAKTGISTSQASAITANTAKNSYPSADATKLAGLSADSVDRQVDGSTTDPVKFWTGTTAQYNALTPASDVLYNITDTPAGTNVTSVVGTNNEVDVVISGTQATVSLDTAITGAITANTAKTGITTAQSTAITNNTAKTGITTAQASAIVANTAKQSVAGLNQVGATILSTDSVVYYAGAALAPRRKVFSSVPLSVFNNDAGFVTSSGTGTVTDVTGTANQIDVVTGTTTPVISLNNTITSAITANTNKTGITTAQSNAITANTAKVGITTAQANAITANTSKTGITNAQSSAITANTAKISYPTSASDKLATLSADSVDRQANGGTTDPIKFWTGTTAQYNALTPVNDVLYNITDTPTGTTVTSVVGTSGQIDVTTVGGQATVSLDTAITGAIAANTSKTGITTAQATAITDNTAKNSYPTADSTKLAGIEALADVTDTDNVVASLTAGDNITISAAGVIAASGGGSVDAIEFMVTSYGFESDLSGAGGVFNFNSYTSTHSGTLNGFMRFYTNGALTANAFYTGGATLRATTVAGTITLPTIDSNGNAIPAYTAGQSLVITNPAGDVFTANLASEVTTGLPTDFPTDLSPWRTSTTEVSAGFPADVVGDIFSTETVAVANQVFNQGALIYYLTEGYQKTSAGTLTTAGTAAEIPTVDTANDWTTTTAAGTSTTVLGTAGEIDVTTVGSTATASLNTAITGAITNNTAKTGISAAQATAITDNTAKTGISTAQATAITNNTAKTSFPGFGTTSTTALRGDTSFPSLTAVNAWTNTNAFNSSSSNGSIQIAGRIVHAGDTNTYIEYTPDQVDIVAGGVPFIRTQEGTDNQLRFNGSNNDVDYYFGNGSGSEWMTYNSGTNAAVIGAGSLTVTNGIARETGGSTTAGIKFWSGTEAQYTALGTGRDQNTIYYVE